jgi:hypothetical protein
MRSITAMDLLATWERGLTQSGVRRAVTVLTAAHSELTETQLLQLPLGQLGSLTLDIRHQLFGPELICLACCPACREQLELNLNVADIQIAANDSPESALHCEVDGYRLEFRLPDSRDLMLAEAQHSVAAAHQLLLSRCLLSASIDRCRCEADELPSHVLAAMETAMSAADPQANVQLDLTCPACAHNWLAAFDIASYVWKEINAWAKRVLIEVHLLAKSYAWAEADILAMTPTRRRLYLEQIAL